MFGYLCICVFVFVYLLVCVFVVMLKYSQSVLIWPVLLNWKFCRLNEVQTLTAAQSRIEGLSFVSAGMICPASYFVFVYLSICVFVYLCICVFVYLCICAFVYLCICVFE